MYIMRTPYERNIMKKYIDNLKAQAEENPLLALAIGAGAVTAVSKLIEASTERQRARTWEMEVNRRNRMN
jgi:hypothetical protein